MAARSSKTSPPTPDLARLRNLTIEAAHAAGKVLRKYFGKKFTVREKKGAGLVTNADTEAEAAAIQILKKAGDRFEFLAEESAPDSSRARSLPGRWILDPLDGTTNFVHGFPMFCVSIAAEWNGKTVVGVVYHPILDDTYVAVRGQGAFINGTRLKVSKTKRLTDSLLTTGFHYRKDELRFEMKAFERLSEIARAIRRPGSAALDLAYTARGVFDGFWERNLSPWDIAAGALLVQEAGGKVTDFSGKPITSHTHEILATNKNLHTSVRQSIAPESCPI